jgi:hypothetical protein
LTSFLALYRGDTVSAAKIIAVSADPELVRDFGMRRLAEPGERELVTALRDPERGGWRAAPLVLGEVGSCNGRKPPV